MPETVATMTAWLTAHAPPLLVIVPMIASAFAAILPSARMAWAVALAGALGALLFAALLVTAVLTSGVQSYALGAWAPPLGIEYRVDGLNAGMALLVALIGVLCAVYAPASARAEIERERTPLFYSALLLCLSGLLGVAITGDAFNMFVFLEISSISTYALVAMGARRDRRALSAAFNYLVMGTIGATFFVIGVGFLYMATGTLNMAGIAEALPALQQDRTVQVGFAFITVGLGLKLAMYPLHSWLPGAYTYAPTVVTAFLAATATKVAFYAMLRFGFMVFDPQWGYAGAVLVWMIAPLGALGMIFASIMAVLQTDVRRVFAYSSVAQVGAMLLGAGAATAAGLSASMLHLFNHALMKGAIFMALGVLWLHFGATRVAELRGLGRAMPWTAAALAIGGLSLIGVPGTAGFVSKWALLNAWLDLGWWPAVAVLAFMSVLSFFYVGRVLEAMYLHAPPPREHGAPAPKAGALTLAPLWALAIANIVFGLWAEFPIRLAQAAANTALGLMP